MATRSNSSSLGSAEEAKRVFDKYDKNGDGKISAEELREAMDSIGTRSTTSEEAGRIISEIDKDGDGHVDFDEFLEFFQAGSAKGSGDEDSLKGAFEYYDLDKNGLISATELHSVLKKLGEKCSLGDCRKMISSVDRDGDGHVNFEEFKEMMTKSSS